MKTLPEDSQSRRCRPEAGFKSFRLACLDDIRHCLPGMVFSAGFFCLLTGMVWVSDRGLYSRLFYWTIALPAVFSAAASPRESAGLLKSRIFLMYLLFACYTVITLFWSESDDDVLGLIKRPFFVALAFLAVFEFGRRCHALLMATVKWSAVFSVFMALYILYFFFAVGGQGRLQGDGALSNPLLISHVFGFFLALWLGYYFSKRKLIEPLFFFVFAVLIGLLFATGSRTPLLATVFTVTWLTILAANHRKSIVVICTTLVLASMILLFSPEAITQRGLSYRPEIWMDVIRQILAEPWFGHGFGTPLQVWVEDLNQAFSDPHNLTLSVLYSGGIIGGALWIAVYFTALWEAWRWRHDRWVFAFSATVVYGLAAGLSEGGSFFSRPKEHWSLIWIPLVLLSYAAFRASTNERGE